MNHILDIQDKYFNDIKKGIKTFEIRRNNRNYSIGDDLTLVNLNLYVPGWEVEKFI